MTHFIILMHFCIIVVATSNALIIPNFSSILVFGDSTVDSGNNNYILTLGKGNNLPYGRDFPGLDDLTLVSTGGGSIPMSKQIELFKAYVEIIKGIAGEDKAKQILGDALVIISAGSNDLVFNFYDLPASRRMMFNMDQYHDYLHDRLQMFIKDQIYRMLPRVVNPVIPSVPQSPK
ncbi:hypothetical protein RIF29_17208 [Crotalaria pallida]|uniref:SGNH hydrolase-type esterase domain-containing protein n=1 Tax=Crotalaria pallida TaxID=3830 RepID=A0AAN9FK38_CROPI